MNSKLLYGAIGLVIGIVSTMAVLTSILPSNIPNKGGMMSSGVSETLDAHFIEQMIPHHEDAITMARLAQSKAQRAEVKELAENIITSQGKEITQMKNWYKDWYVRDLPTGDQVMQHHGMMSNSSSMHMGMMGTDEDMKKLSEAVDFDTEFVKEMILHHQMAVMMANMLKDGTQRPEMKKLADDIVTAQTKEIDQMRQWFLDWEK